MRRRRRSGTDVQPQSVHGKLAETLACRYSWSPLDCSVAHVAVTPMDGMSTVKAMEKARGLLTYVAAGAVMLSASPSARKG